MPNDLDPKYYFEDNQDAAQQLIQTLPIALLSENETVVIGVSESGVYFADQIAKAVDARMDILLTAPIMAPNNSELPIAMVSETEEVVIHKVLIDAFEINEDYIYNEAHRKYEEDVLKYIYKYRKGRELSALKDKYVVLVDSCVETGLTMMVALKSVIEEGAKNVYIATPLLDKSVYTNLLSVCDGLFCPHKISDYISIEYYYRVFTDPTFDEVRETIVSQEQRLKAKTEN